MTKWEQALQIEVERLQKEIEARKLRIEHYTQEWGAFAKSGDCANFGLCGVNCPCYEMACDKMSHEEVKSVLMENA